jgi:hypothetical protein
MIVVFDRDSDLSPLDLTLAPHGHIVVASECPFGSPGALTSVREYDSGTGKLVRVSNALVSVADAQTPAQSGEHKRQWRAGPIDTGHYSGYQISSTEPARISHTGLLAARTGTASTGP